MKLMTKEILNKLPEIRATENTPASEVKVIAKFFDPTGYGTWYATEYDAEHREFFGYVKGQSDYESALGYFSLDELESITVRFGLKIERDIYWNSNTTLEEVKNS